MHTSSIRNDALHDLTFIKITVARFVGTGGFIITHSNGHTKRRHRQLKTIRDYI